MLDHEVFLKNIPSDGSKIGNIKLQSILGWEDEKYQAVKESLVNEGKLVRGQGRGGTLRLFTEEDKKEASEETSVPKEPKVETKKVETKSAPAIVPTVNLDIVTPEHEEELLAILLPDKGTLNRIAQETLGYSDELYLAVKTKLIQDGKIMPHRGPGGAVRLRQEGEDAYTAPAEKPAKVTKEIEKVDISQYASDEEAIFAQLPEEAGLSMGFFIKALDITEERYLEARRNLLLEGKVLPSQGPGRVIRRRLEGEEAWSPPVVKQPKEIEKVDISQYASDEEAIFAQLPEEGGLSKVFFINALDLTEERFLAAKQNLLLEGKILPGKGPHGAIRKRQEGEEAWKPKEEKVTLDLSQFESDEEAFMSQVPEDEEINVRTLNAILGFEIEKFREVKHDLLVNGSIVPGEGRGMIRRRKENEEIWEDESPEPRKKASSEEEEEGIVREIPDPVIFSCSEEATALPILDALHAKYKKSVFYFHPEGIKLKLNKYAGITVPIRSEMLGEVMALAQAAFDSIDDVKAEETPTEEAPTEEHPAEGSEKISTEEKVEEAGA